jgi:UDP-N-acetylglucosamine-lysosomal-enzyme
LQKTKEAIDDEDEFIPFEIMNSFENIDNHKYNFQNRKILDVYGDSLRHVNSLLNQVFGIAGGRKAPAHMPHFIDTNILLAMHQQWLLLFLLSFSHSLDFPRPVEFNKTSSQKLRSTTDMQFSFSYFYFYMSQRKKFDFNEIWEKELDKNHDGY